MPWYDWLAVGLLAVWFVTEVLVPGALAIVEEIRNRRSTNPREREGER